MTLITKTVDPKTTTIKFLYSYGGKITPRRTDGKLRYIGGHTRVLSVDRSISFAEVMVKLGELIGTSMTLKCKLPTEDLDTLISITSDEDLQNLIEEYDRFAKDAKITAVLFPIKSLKKITPVSSSEDLCSAVSTAKSSAVGSHRELGRAMCHHLGGARGMVYKQQNYRCHVGTSPSYRWFVPTGNYCR